MRDDVLKLGYTSVIFVDMGAKVDGTYCCDLLLSQQLLPVIRHDIASFCILENSAPACRARYVITDINISSHGSVTTLLRCGDLYCKFPAECNTERILKIGHYLAKLWTRVWCLVFFWTTVYIFDAVVKRLKQESNSAASADMT